MPPARGTVLAALLAVRLADTSYAVLAKWCLNGNARGAALVFGLYRNAGALPFMFALAAVTDGCTAPAARDLPHLALLCFTAVFASQACYLIGLKDCNRRDASPCASPRARRCTHRRPCGSGRLLRFRASALTPAYLRSLILATALGNLTPIVSAVLGWALGRESMGYKKLLGIALAVAGSIVMVDPGARSHGGSADGAASEPPAHANAAFLRGCALLAASPVAWASSLYVQKPLLRRYSPFSLTAWTFAGGTAAMAILAAALYGKQPDAWRVGRGEAIALVAAALVGCLFKFCAVSWLNRRVDATLLCILETGGHVVTMLLSVPVLGEPLYARYLGAIPVFAGCLLVALASHWGAPEEVAEATQQAQAQPQLQPPAAKRRAWWPRRRADALADARQALLGEGPEGPSEEDTVDDTAPAEAANAEEAI